MIKKIISKALLTMFMDKKARKTLHALQIEKKMSTVTIKVETDIALSQSEHDPLSDMDHDKITALIRESLDTAEKEVTDKKNKSINKNTKSAVSKSRKDLIENALIIFKSKSHIIDELPAEQQEKLKLLAFQVFGEQLKDS